MHDGSYVLLKNYLTRLGLILAMLFGYVGGMCYFTHFVYDTNSEASEMMFVLNKRGLYLLTMNFVLMEAIQWGNKALAGYNVGIILALTRRTSRRREIVHDGHNRRSTSHRGPLQTIPANCPTTDLRGIHQPAELR